MSSTHFDVAIIGGGPAGSTVGTLLRKYNPDLNVVILEREKFPRDHVGESQLPPIGAILQEMGCWEKVESAEFPIKIGVTYRWGKSPELWDFDFLPLDQFQNRPRPAPYAGDRTRTALQVDRAKYDEILLRHAESCGCVVHEECGVKSINKNGDSIESLVLQDNSMLTARWYIDASGAAGFLRRSMDIASNTPSNLKNIAIWDYWENAEWADEIGVGGTRVQVLSQPHGWMWFIPLGPTRTSIGLICPVDHFKSLEKSTEEVYLAAIAEDDRVAGLTHNATRRGEIETIKDWSYLAERTVGDNWFLVGEAAGFADPILAAGMTLAHGSARECAYTILELVRNEQDANWLTSSFNENQRTRISQHIRFADFWYASNGQFSDLQDHCSRIAAESGLTLTPEKAWQWISQGGFTSGAPGQAVVAGFLDIAGAKQCAEMFMEGEFPWETNEKNCFHLNLDGADSIKIPIYREGKVLSVECLVRDGHRLPKTGINEVLLAAIERSPDIADIIKIVLATLKSQLGPDQVKFGFHYALQALEVLVNENWVKASLDPNRPKLSVATPKESQHIRVRSS